MATIYNPLSPPHNHDEVYAKIGEGGGGVTDHGELTGLEDNDHPQYLGVNDPAQDTYKFGGNPPTAYVMTINEQTIDGVKTFGSIPVLPSSNPTAVNQAVRKGYVDEQMKTISAARAATSAQSIPKSSWTQVTLTASTWDTDNMNSSLNVITIKTSGLYLLTGFAQFAAGAQGFVGSSIFIDGTGVFYYNGAPTSFGTHCPVQGIASLSVGQVISLRVYHEGSTNISTQTTVPAYLRVVRIGAI